MSSTVLQRAEDVAVPQKPFQPLQLGGQGGRQLGWDAQALGQLHHHGDAYREVEPVQQMLGLRVEVVGQVADVVAAVGEEGDLLVGLHPLGGKRFEQPAFGFGVVGLHVPETR